MYDNSLLPIALANKLVSLSDHPSSVFLEKFAKRLIKLPKLTIHTLWQVAQANRTIQNLSKSMVAPLR